MRNAPNNECLGQQIACAYKRNAPNNEKIRYVGNNVGKSEIVLKRAWLIAVIPPNWIIVCGFYPEIQEVLEYNLIGLCM